jgi:DnaJ-domain-containing protein 1
MKNEEEKKAWEDSYKNERSRRTWEYYYKPWKDYYEILRVNPDASQTVIKKAYHQLAHKYHPDKNHNSKIAEEKFKEINNAYDVLKDEEERVKFHYAWQKKHLPKPKLIVTPSIIICKNIEPGKVIKKSFTIDNTGGPFNGVWFNRPKGYVIANNWYSLNDGEELPMRVDLRIQMDDYDQEYEEVFTVVLDDEVAKVTVKVQTQSRPTYNTERTYSYTPPPNQPSTPSSASSNTSKPTKTNWSPILWLCFIAFIIFLIIPKSTSNHQDSQKDFPLVAESTFPSIKRAGEIMGKNFVGIEEAAQKFNVQIDEKNLKALKEIPFSENTLIRSRNTHVLIADFGSSIVDIKNLNLKMRFNSSKKSYNIFESNLESKQWVISEKFSEITENPQWRLIRKETPEKLQRKSWEDQKNLIGDNEEIPTARTMIYFIIAYYFINKPLVETELMRTSTIASSDGGYRVCVACSVWSGIHIINSYLYDDNSYNIGIAIALKPER